VQFRFNLVPTHHLAPTVKSTPRYPAMELTSLFRCRTERPTFGVIIYHTELFGGTFTTQVYDKLRNGQTSGSGTDSRTCLRPSNLRCFLDIFFKTSGFKLVIISHLRSDCVFWYAPMMISKRQFATSSQFALPLPDLALCRKTDLGNKII
jgi:hypothetical protein